MSKKENGVSPVIGVLLMLTLTLIIAAVVNMYAGGLVKTDPKPPTVNLQVSYSSSTGMIIRHMSGDPIPLASAQFMIRPGESMGTKYQQYPSIINLSYFTNMTGTSLSSLTAIVVGDTIRTSKDNIRVIQVAGNVNPVYYLSNTSNVGKTFDFELYFKNSLISRNQVLIEQ